jgi:hypothetical protein
MLWFYIIVNTSPAIAYWHEESGIAHDIQKPLPAEENTLKNAKFAGIQLNFYTLWINATFFIFRDMVQCKYIKFSYLDFKFWKRFD